jgi:acyl-coenzyme A synthetase/AMP-(fatty) acid ligase
MGDVGYLDEKGRFWYCGRKSQRVETKSGPLFTECAEAVVNEHPAVRRSALVGVGTRSSQLPVLIVELKPGISLDNCARESLERMRLYGHAQSIRHILAHPSLPVDVRHNAKINREQLTVWAARRIHVAESTQSVAALRSHAERGNEG